MAIKVTKENCGDYIVKWESGELYCEDIIVFFQYLINEGHVWKLKWFYGKQAMEFIGFSSRKPNHHEV